jgi:general secretion pathway protein E
MPELVAQLGLDRYVEAGEEIRLYHPVGCEHCNETGYFGRSSLTEILVVTDEIRRLILKRAEAMELHRLAVQEGMRTMYDDGMAKALSGLTTVEEVLRVTRDV